MINLTDYNDFFIFLSGLLIIGGAIYFFLRHRLQNIFISEEEISRLKVSNQISDNRISFPKIFERGSSSFKKLRVVLLIIIIAGFLLNQFLMWKVGSSGILNKLFSISINITKK